MMIWKFARPDPRVIMLSKSNKECIANSNSSSALIKFTGLGCSTDHLVSRIPVPNLLHICSESRAIALKWYRLRFQPACAHGGTYFDTQRDYIYYGTEEQKLLVNTDSVAPAYGWVGDTNRWAKERHSIPNMVVYLEFRNSYALVLKRFMEISAWCNQYADKILWVYENELERGALVSDLKPLLLFRTVDNTTFESTVDTRVLFDRWLRNIQILRPWWKRFNPTSIDITEESATTNQVQRYGFKKRLFLDKKVNFSFGPQVDTAGHLDRHG
jgi:hypothetical protein